MTDPRTSQDLDTEFIGMLADFLQGARKSKAIFDGYVQAGFTQDQALHLTSELVRPRGDSQ